MQRRLPPISTTVPPSSTAQPNPGSSSSPFSPSQSQQATSGPLQARARIASSSSSQPPSSAASLPTASQGGVGASSGGGGGGPSRIARASPSLSQTASPSSAFPSSAISGTQQSQSLSKIVITQIFVLLGTINQEKDKAKRETQAEQISALIAQYGMDVFPKFFRRALQLNQDYIFSNSNRNPEGSYELLLKHVQKIRQDAQEADNVAESIDSTEGDLFKNFDLSKFMDHFKLDPVAKSMLALSLRNASKPDLRTKADAILSNNYQTLLMTILNPSSETGDDLPPSYLYPLLDKIIREPPRNWSDEGRTNLQFAIRSRYEKIGIEVPTEIMNVLQLSELLVSANSLVKLIHKTGPRGTSSLDSCKEMLVNVEARDTTFTQVANALLFMVFSQDMGQAYDPSTFVATLRDHRCGKRLDWQDVVHSFDREGLSVTKRQFLAIYEALLPLAQEYENFDIQLLWGGNWTQPDTQLSFVVAFLSCSHDELDASTIPRLRKAFTTDDFEDASEEAKTYAAEAVRHPFVSLDATKALFNMIFQSQETYKHANKMGIPETVINPHTDFFVLAVGAIPPPWGPLQTQAFNQLFTPFLRKRLPADNFVFHGLWKRTGLWLAHRLVEAYQANPMDLYFIFEHAQEHGWLPTLTSISSEFGVDLAALAHSRGQLDLVAWMEQSYNALPEVFPQALKSIIEDKARVEIASQRDPDAPPSVSLSVKTVFEFLNFLQPHLVLDDDTLVVFLKTCISAYPRLINFGEGVDQVIEANGKNGNALSPEADQSMNEHFKKLYSGESKVRDVIEALQRYKQSEDLIEQELFACMITHGLFDEYNCLAEYPVDALSTTAVLFGSIINFNLLPSIALQVALALVLDSIHSSTSREEKMYKFGLQALKQFQSRLHEWPSFCERLLRVGELQGTDIWSLAEEILRNAQGGDVEAPGSPQALTNGNAEEYLEPAIRNFSSIHSELPVRGDFYETPTEDVQDQVLFVLNNVSPGNVVEKEGDLKKVLEEKYHQWFAEYLVDQRAKLQSNFQNLYLHLLDLIDNQTLWQEVLRETYVSIVRLLNSESTMTSTTEKGHLKSLGSWLGSITLARDEPIKLRNISFKDLLVEAHASSRLPVVIPFTSKVLAEAAKSELFRPPNPWTVEILKVLLELYHHAELRINLKFEIETLCSTLNFDMKKTEPATAIRDSMALSVEEEFVSGIPDGLEGFNELSLAGLSRNRASRSTFSPASLTEALPDISARLSYPPHSSNVVPAEHARQIFLQAAQQAINEIIFPVVERSVTIAAIAASQLVTKDFATEPDENKFRNAAHSLVKSLSGCLAMVTCREPLRMSMSNNVRALARTLPGDGFAEGVILMFVNDNIDIVCRVIEEAAEKHSIAEIENQIRDAVHVRQVHQSSRTEEGFNYPPISKWAYVIPEPYKPLFGGLRTEQLAIYEDFGPSRNLTSHTVNPSQDTRQQITDAIQDQFTAVPNIPTPAEAPAVLRQVPQQQRIIPAQGMPGAGQSQMNGYNEPVNLHERAEGLFIELLRLARETPEEHIKDLGPASAMREIYEQLAHVVDASGNQRDSVALLVAHRIPGALYQEAERRIEVEVLVQLLAHLCQLSIIAARQIIQWLSSIEDERIFNAPVTACLISARLMDLPRVDTVLSKALRLRKHLAIDCLADMVDELLLSDHPLAIRANFAGSFDVLLQWIQEESDLEPGKAILNKLQVPEQSNALATLPSSKQDEIEHIFEEWLQLNRHGVPDKMIAAFIRQLYLLGTLRNQEETAVFIRLCIDLAMAAYDHEENAPYGGSIDLAYLHIDALASLIVSLIVYQGNEPEGAVKPSSSDFLDSILSIVILYQAHHYKAHGEGSNQKIFFRLYSGMLCEIHNSVALDVSKDEIYLVMSRAFLALQPDYFPGFAFGWLTLISHRIFMPAMITMRSETAIQRYTQLLNVTFQTLGNLVNSSEGSGSVDFIHRAQDFYRAVLRVLVVVHHDFPDFLVDNHLSLCNSIPGPFVQLKNLILSAVPSNCPELPSPFTAGLKVDLLEEMRISPTIRNDFVAPLRDAGILKMVDQYLGMVEIGLQDINRLCALLMAAGEGEAGTATAEIYQTSLIHALVIYIGFQGIAASSGQVYSKSGPHAKLLFALVRNSSSGVRCQLINAMVNQLRFPNSHTHYFMCALIDIFAMPPTDEVQDEVQEMIVRVLLERLAVQRPHPWGVIVALLELYKNGNYQFWDLPFVKASPEVERLFSALNNHINNSPRVMA